MERTRKQRTWIWKTYFILKRIKKWTCRKKIILKIEYFKTTNSKSFPLTFLHQKLTLELKIWMLNESSNCSISFFQKILRIRNCIWTSGRTTWCWTTSSSTSSSPTTSTRKQTEKLDRNVPKKMKNKSQFSH